jgi:EmrB/QacA subfamily drug resistance transporter
VFTLSSIACSLAPNGSWLIGARVVQGVGAACIMATAPAIITQVFPPQERGKVLGINSMFIYLGLSLGPVLGGVLTGLFNWQAIFWVNVPIGITAMALAWVIIKEVPGAKTESFDVLGAVSFGVSLVSLLLALTFGTQYGWASASIITLLVLSVTMGALFLWQEKRMGERAMLNLRLFTDNRMFAAGNLSALINYTAFFGVSFIISFYLQRILGLSVLQTGLVLLAMPVTMAIVAPMSGWASDRIGSRTLSTVGMVILAFGLVVLSFLKADSGIPLVIIGLAVLGLGNGLFASPNTSAVMGSVRRDQLGVASGTISTMRTMGQSLSLTIMGAVMSIVAGASIVDMIFGGGNIDDVESIEQSFLNGMQAAFLVGAALALVGAMASSVRGGRSK